MGALIASDALAQAPRASASRPQAATAKTLSVTDIKGRTVVVPAGARRMLIDDGRYLVALSLIHPDPVSVLGGWPKDINRIGDKTYAQFKARYPRIDSIAQTSSSAGTFSMEKVLSVRPDVAVFSLGAGPSDDEVKQLATAGIPVVFIDFFTHPFQNMDNSLVLLGKLTGREAAAQKYVAFRKAHLAKITDRLRTAKNVSRPNVFLEAHAGISEDCCNSPGKGNIGDYIELVGGHNIGADVLPGATGKLNIEYVMSKDPAVYIATGGPHLEKNNGLVLGPGYTPVRSRESLTRMSNRTGVSLLSAVKRGNVHGLSHQLLNSPVDILAVEALARWIHPELFRDIDPARTLAEMNSSFLSVPLEGTYWIDLR
ncbi:MAG: ABC transporter substrate-binding protein [Gemmatimonas sp.]